MHSDEGVIKFSCEWAKGLVSLPAEFKLFAEWRDRIHGWGKIGVSDKGVGYGNISFRHSGNQFYITGSGTSKYSELTSEHMALVEDFDINRNWLRCTGLVKASSESLTHAALYASSTDISCVIHIHDSLLWRKYLHVFPTTNKECAYGTSEMALEVKKCANAKLAEASSDAYVKDGIILMGGHEDGILIYGQSIEESGLILQELLGLGCGD